MENTLNIVWEKCHHGVEKRSPFGCDKCRQELSAYKNMLSQKERLPVTRIPIKRGCPNKDGCFCTGACNEIIGYRDPFPGETLQGH